MTMESLQHTEIGVIEHLQMSLYNWDKVMMFLSHLGDPRNAFLLYFPVAFCLSRVVGLRVMWVAVAAEWFNAILKWILFGQRPYWWVHETKIYTEQNRPNVDQFELTCETGPGNPSGHAMVTTAVWFVMMSSLANHIQSGSNPAQGAADMGRLVGRLPWLLLVAISTAVCVSRIYIATHFPHQVLLGTIIGIILGQLFIRVHFEAFSFGTYIFFTAFFFLSIYGVYAFLCGLDFDPMWSLNLALKWCAEKSWLNLDTTLFYAVARDIGAISFLGVAECLPLKIPDRSGQYLLKIIAALFCLAYAQAVEGIALSRVNLYVFYIQGALKYGVVSLGIIVIKFVLFKIFSSKVKNG